MARSLPATAGDTREHPNGPGKRQSDRPSQSTQTSKPLMRTRRPVPLGPVFAPTRVQWYSTTLSPRSMSAMITD